MGCGGSKAATPLECDEICTGGVKEMLELCITNAFKNTNDLKIPLPPEMAKFRTAAAELRQAAADTKSSLTQGDAGAAGAAAGAKAGATGAMIGGMLGKAAAAAGGAAGDAAESLAGAAADALEAATNKIEKPFEDAGKDLLAQKGDEITKLFQETLADTMKGMAHLDGATVMVRGQKNTNYAAAPPTAISDWMVSKAKDKIEAAMLPIAQAVIAQLPVVLSTQDCIEKYNKVDSMLASQLKRPADPIKLDMNKYIVEQTIAGIGKLMGTQETENRKSPAGKSELFALCFSDQLLGHEDHVKFVSSKR